MSAQLLLLFVCLLLGAACQLGPAAEGLRSGLWRLQFWFVSPVLVFVTFLTLQINRQLLMALIAVITATWLVAAAGYIYAAIVAEEREERGALALAAGFGNTGFVGYPLAQLAFGHPGLALAVVYDRLSFLVPALSVSTVVARLHSRSDRVAARRRLYALAANPPLLALGAAVALRTAGGGAPLVVETRTLAATVVGPIGFFLLGLCLPLERPVLAPLELRRAAGALAVRFAGGPLALFAVGNLVGAEIPGVFYLLAGMPCAFHLLVLARVYELRPALMRLLVVGSTLPAVTVVALVSGIVG